MISIIATVEMHENQPTLEEQEAQQVTNGRKRAAATTDNLWGMQYEADELVILRDKHDFELDFKKFWEQFRSSSSEKEKEMALNMAVDVFCRLVKQQSSVAQYQSHDIDISFLTSS
ncbi:hypothetical protein J5N97_017526 [Dioscorea zingiberensis]|uniref:Uncharacterized protein n=1 Tax=Dioscorea zingiberensis TaxID=325984 RepID=A0A9D5CLD0_9LILI|nr:hypothetical protein J5N97_017526 [Dioscorea zingiberensis]